MGISGISLWQILIVLVLAVLLFGSGKIRRLGEDLGGAISGFRRSLQGNREGSASTDNPSKPIAEFSQIGER
ncbi:sec-independent protein translocase protein TatA [Microbulbifer sp. NBRC 101763]|uniref:twin-arginine translocase TatA/TatE family subunit n=1 Tax=Microbulbifer TaxID=48073 RepID=UPI00036BD6CB|nr:twin-arginine translocase TatA/TatE family subunit [Microbulbifer variabilis]